MMSNQERIAQTQTTPENINSSSDKVKKSLETIDEIEKLVGEEFGVTGAERTRLADDALVFQAEKTAEEANQGNAQVDYEIANIIEKVETVVVEGALEESGAKTTTGNNPIMDLEKYGLGQAVTAAISELYTEEARLPSGYDVASLAVTVIEKGEKPQGDYDRYFDDRRADNLEKLASRPKLQELYKRTFIERPSYIKHVALIDDTNLTENAYFTSIDSTTSKKISAVHFNIEHNFENKEQEPGTQLLIKKFALQLGIDYKEMIQNKNVFDAFVLMHEFGHAADFISRDYTPLAINGNYSLTESIIESSNISNDRYKSEKTTRLINRKRTSFEDLQNMNLLAFNEDPNSKDPDTRERVRKAVLKRISKVNATRYRQIPEEIAADFFAREIIIQNADLFFRPHNEPDEGRGLIASGRPSIELDVDDWRDVVGLHSGTKLKMTRVESNIDGKIVKKTRNGEIDITEGVLAPLLLSENSITISKSGDVKDLYRSRPLGEITGVKARRHNGKLEYLLTDQGGRMAVMEIED